MKNENISYIESKIFERIDFTAVALPKGEYESCSFKDCDFSGCDLSGFSFSECSFSGSNLSLVKTSQTAFKEVQFNGCKLMGLHFENCNTFLFALDFDHCLLNLSSFYRLNLKRSKFKSCSLQEVDFSESDLSTVSFDNCDLAGALFDNTNLEKSDFRSASNYAIDPETNRMKKAKFSLSGIPGLLEKHGIIIEV